MHTHTHKATNQANKEHSNKESSLNNNNKLFMVPHLVRAQSTYKDMRIH